MQLVYVMDKRQNNSETLKVLGDCGSQIKISPVIISNRSNQEPYRLTSLEICATKNNSQKLYKVFDSMPDLTRAYMLEDCEAQLEDEEWPRITMGTYAPVAEPEIATSFLRIDNINNWLREEWPRITMGSSWLETEDMMENPQQEPEWPRFTQCTVIAVESNTNFISASREIQHADSLELWPIFTQGTVIDYEPLR